MGQEEVIKILEKNKKPMSRSQIAEGLELDPIKVSHILRILLKHNDIKCFELDRFQAAQYLDRDRPHRRTRFYYL